MAIVQIPADWPAYNGDAYQPPSLRTGDGKLVAGNRAVVTVMLGDKGVGIPQRYGR